VQIPRIVALALIGIMLSSSSVSVADGYTVWLDINEINTMNDQNYDQQFYNINLKDTVAASLSNKKISGPAQTLKIKLVDSVSAFINVLDQPSEERFPSKIISIKLSDGVNANITDYNNADSKIVHIKHTDERKALWERIFPLDRIRNKMIIAYHISN